MALLDLSERMRDRAHFKTLLDVLCNTTHVWTLQWVCQLLRTLITQPLSLSIANDSSSLNTPEFTCTGHELRQLLIENLVARCTWFFQSTPNDISRSVALSGYTQLMAHVWHVLRSEMSPIYNSDAQTISQEANESWRDKNATVRITLSNDPELHEVAQKLIMDDPSIESTWLGITLLSSWVEEMDTQSRQLGSYTYTKMAHFIKFRDYALLLIVKIAISTLEKFLDRLPPETQPEKAQYDTLIVMTQSLILKSFKFDFDCIRYNDTLEDEYCPIPVNEVWASTVKETCMVALRFYNTFINTPQAHLAPRALEIVSYCASIKSSIFKDPTEFLNVFWKPLVDILTHRRGIYTSSPSSSSSTSSPPPSFSMESHQSPISPHHDPSLHLLSKNSTQLCQLVLRLVINFKPKDFMALFEWHQGFQQLLQFHIDLMHHGLDDSELLYCIIMSWQKLGVQFSKVLTDEGLTFLTSGCSSILKTFIITQCNIFSLSGDEDDLYGVEDAQRNRILNLLPSILSLGGRDDVMNTLLSLIQDKGTQFIDASTPTTAFPELQQSLAWLVHVTTELINKEVYKCSLKEDGHDLSLDIQLIITMFQLLQYHNEVMHQTMTCIQTQQLEYALISFLKYFGHHYARSPCIKSTWLHHQLQSQLNLHTPQQVMHVLFLKITQNFAQWHHDYKIMLSTLELLTDLVYSMVIHMDTEHITMVQDLLLHHAQLPMGVKNRMRRAIYKCLGIIVCYDEQDVEMLFSLLMGLDEKMAHVAKSLKMTSIQENGLVNGNNVLVNGNKVLVNDNDGLSHEVIQIMNELHGLMMACTQRVHFEIVFDWLHHSDYYNIVCIASIHHFSHHHWKPLWAILRWSNQMMQVDAEELQDHDQRKPYAYLLFKNTAQLHIQYANQLMQCYQQHAQPCQQQQQDETQTVVPLFDDTMIKATLLFSNCCLTWVKSIDYLVNIHTFSIYNDKLIEQWLLSTLQVLFSIDIVALQYDPALLSSVFKLLESICEHMMSDLFSPTLHQNMDVLMNVLIMLKQGLKLNCNIQLLCVKTIEHLANHVQKIQQRRGRFTLMVNILNDRHAQFITTIMFMLLDMTSIQKPLKAYMIPALVALVQLYPDQFDHLCNTIIDSQRHVDTFNSKLIEAFSHLTNRNTTLDESNRRIFQLDVSEFGDLAYSLLDVDALYAAVQPLIE